VDTLSPDIENINQFIDGNVGIVIAVLESGNSVELKATGYSMFPTLRPGDRVVVKPLTKGELPMLGTVVVFMGNGGTVQRRNGATEERRKGATEERCNSLPRFIGGITEEGHNNITAEHHNVILVMHRLTEIRVDDRVIPQLITRGDSLNESDKPWPRQQLLGVAVSYKRSGKEHLIKNFIPGAWRYKYNRRLLWMFGKIKRLSLGPGKLLKNK
jgi:signal peptidase I